MENPDDFLTVGLADMMEVLLNDSHNNVHVNRTGKGQIILKTAAPFMLFFRKEMTNAKEQTISYALEPLVPFDEQVTIKKVRQGLYDFTTNDKLVEIYFDKDRTTHKSLQAFDEQLVSLRLMDINEVLRGPNNEETSKLGSYIETGGNLICAGIDFTSHWLAIGITQGGKQLKKSITPLEEPTSIDPQVERSLSMASTASSSVKGATKAISTIAIDTFAFIIDKSLGRSLKSGDPTVKSTARASIKVIDSFSDACGNILYATTDTASELIEHRYGNDAATCAKHSGTVAKNSYKAHENIRKIGTKSIIKAVGKVVAKRNDVSRKSGKMDVMKDDIVKRDDVYVEAVVY